MTTTATLPAPTDDVERAEHDLAEHGICAVTGVLDPTTLKATRDALYGVADEEAARGLREHFIADTPGDETNQRVWNLPSRSWRFVDLAEHPTALRLIRSAIGDRIILGNLSANITGPGGGEMYLHADQNFLPEPWPTRPQGANAAWALDDFTVENGATCFVPGSHLLHRAPTKDDLPEAVPYEAPAGSLIVFESRIWHRTGHNSTQDQRRAGAFGWYTSWIYRPQENWQLSLDPVVLQGCSDTMLELLGYRTVGLGVVNGRSPR